MTIIITSLAQFKVLISMLMAYVGGNDAIDIKIIFDAAFLNDLGEAASKKLFVIKLIREFAGYVTERDPAGFPRTWGTFVPLKSAKDFVDGTIYKLEFNIPADRFKDLVVFKPDLHWIEN